MMFRPLVTSGLQDHVGREFLRLVKREACGNTCDSTTMIHCANQAMIHSEGKRLAWGFDN